MRPDTREKLGEQCSNLYDLANSALYDEVCDLLSEGEYVEDIQSADDFICFIDGEEINALSYLEENDVIYNYDGSTSTQFGFWE